MSAGNPATPIAPSDGPREAVKTYIEQTKLLVSLASAFILAPAAALPFIGNTASVPSLIVFVCLIVGELAFVFSVLCGYLVLGSLAGSQNENKFDVFRRATVLISRGQLGLYLLGLGLFLIFLLSVIRMQEKKPPAASAQPTCSSTITVQ